MRPEPIRKPLWRERGWALVSVLWMLAILTMLVAAAQALSFSSEQREQRALAQARMEAGFHAGIVRAVIGIQDPRAEQRWRVDGVPQDFELDGETVRITIQDQLGLVDLNAADASLINQLLRSAGVAKDDAETLTNNIVDWRSRDSAGLTRLHGTTAEQYARIGMAWRPRHGEFQSVDELRLVLGMTSDLFARIAPALTVYSRHPAIDTGLAPRAALLAYYPDQPDRVDEVLRARNRPANGARGTLAQTANLAGQAFAISVILPARAPGTAREAVVMLTGVANHPFLVLLWR